MGQANLFQEYSWLVREWVRLIFSRNIPAVREGSNQPISGIFFAGEIMGNADLFQEYSWLVREWVG
jgi:hypothetical protein